LAERLDILERIPLLLWELMPHGSLSAGRAQERGPTL